MTTLRDGDRHAEVHEQRRKRSPIHQENSDKMLQRNSIEEFSLIPPKLRDHCLLPSYSMKRSLVSGFLPQLPEITNFAAPTVDEKPAYQPCPE